MAEQYLAESKAQEDAHFWVYCSPSCGREHEWLQDRALHGTWEQQPPELKALGKAHAKRVLERMDAKVMAQMEAKIGEMFKEAHAEREGHQTERAKMTLDELKVDDVRLKAEEADAHERFLDDVVRPDLARREQRHEARRVQLRGNRRY
jgi:hypothetical protein